MAMNWTVMASTVGHLYKYIVQVCHCKATLHVHPMRGYMVGIDEKCGLANSLMLSESLLMHHYPVGSSLGQPPTYVGTGCVHGRVSVCVCVCCAMSCTHTNSLHEEDSLL